MTNPNKRVDLEEVLAAKIDAMPPHQKSFLNYLLHETDGESGAGLRSVFDAILDSIPYPVELSKWAHQAAHRWWVLLEDTDRFDWPAAQGHHHAWPGGLFMHTAAVAQLAVGYAAWLEERLETDIDFDVLLSAALFHDVGKLFEVNREPGGEYSAAGGAVGHIAISKMQWAVVAEQVDVPLRERLHVEHCIDAHHSNAGPAATQPRTAEALILSMADSMDSRVVGFLDALARRREDRPKHFRHGVSWKDLDLVELASWSQL